MRQKIDLQELPKYADNIEKKCIFEVEKEMAFNANNSYRVFFIIDDLKSLEWKLKDETKYELSIRFKGKLITFVRIKDERTDNYNLDSRIIIDDNDNNYVIDFNRDQSKEITYMDYCEENFNYIYKLMEKHVSSIYKKVNFFGF